MKTFTTFAVWTICFLILAGSVNGQRNPDKERKPKGNQYGKAQAVESVPIEQLVGNFILGSPTNNSIIISIIAGKNTEFYVEYGTSSGKYTSKTNVVKALQTDVLEQSLTNLQPNTQYFYRINFKKAGENTFNPLSEGSFFTQRSKDATFSFGVQGDSHPERSGKMFSSELYHVAMKNVAASRPDFFFMIGDDFSIERLIERNEVSQTSVNGVYLNQRQYLSAIGNNTSIFLVNGNHEQAAKYLLDGTAANPAVCAANARIKCYPLPTPGTFYSGDEEKVPNIGFLKDYYAFEWGDALFVTIDPYWHSDSAVDNRAGKSGKRKNLWDITLGKAQYDWFKRTLESSKAKYKFVFTHHVLGTGRGGTEQAMLYEWGGKNRRGDWEFDKFRPGWELPIHQLMTKNKVTIFFQGHDHVFARQELDGVVYQSLPNPADDGYNQFNFDAYQSGTKLPNSGFVNVTVSPTQIKVDYIKACLPKDETETARNGSVVYSYIVKN